QAEPWAEVHTTTCWAVPVPARVPAAKKPPRSAVRAVMVAFPAFPSGSGRVAVVQVMPPSGEVAANGTVWPPAMAAVPMATTVRPLAATAVSAARGAPAGSGTVRWVQVRPPSAEVQAAGLSVAPAWPAATKPPGTAVTARIRAPVPAGGA